MTNLTALGRLILALATAAFGIQYLTYAGTHSGFGPPFTPENQLIAYFAAAVFLVAAFGLTIGRQAHLAAIVLGVALVVRAALYYAPKLVVTPRDPGPWTSAFELLGLASGSFILAATLANKSVDTGPAAHLATLSLFGRVLFAVSLVVFAIQHFMYGHFVAGLIPAWIPDRLFWAYFVAVAFVAAGIAIVSRTLAPLAATLLGTMFSLWVLILHAPRVANALHNGDEWTSLFVALAMSACSFVIAGAMETMGEVTTDQPAAESYPSATDPATSS
jgi:uncharacterized membrane protein YphA (DoxX/SURF4 family)